MYDRGIKPVPERPYSGFTYRVNTLLGITGLKMAKYRTSLWEAVSSPFRVVWRPHLLMALIYEVFIIQHLKLLVPCLTSFPGCTVWLLDWNQRMFALEAHV